MNIFATDPSPKLSARALDDQRLVKMVLETAQILCGGLYLRGVPTLALPYKPTHLGHPAVLWAAMTEENLRWVYRHGWRLSEEYSNRYNKVHKSGEVIEYLRQYCPSPEIKPRRPQTFYNGARHKSLGLDYTHLPVHEAYRAYLVKRWSMQTRPPRWTNSSPPDWRT